MILHISRLESKICVIAPTKIVNVKNDLSEWVDGEIPEKTQSRDKLYKRLRLTKSHVEEL